MSDRITLLCWKCGTQLQNLILPFSRIEECSNCNADLHCCLSCKNYTNTLSDGCIEDRADFTVDKERSNFCDYFAPNPRPSAFTGRDNLGSIAAREKLAELFGEAAPLADTATKTAAPSSDAEKALSELHRLFSKE